MMFTTDPDLKRAVGNLQRETSISTLALKSVGVVTTSEADLLERIQRIRQATDELETVVRESSNIR